MTTQIEIDALLVYAKAAAVAAAPFCACDDLEAAGRAANAINSGLGVDAAVTEFQRVSDRSPCTANVPFWAAATVMWGLMLTAYGARWDMTIPAYAMTASDMAKRVYHDGATLAEELRQWHLHCTPMQRTATDLHTLRQSVKLLHKALARYQRIQTLRFME